MKYRGVIFDMDGVLFDTERIFQQTWHELAEEHQIQLGSGFVREISGSTGRHMHQILETHYRISDGAALAEECRRRMKEKLSAHVPVKAGAVELLRYLRENHIRTAIASSSAPEQIESNLNVAGIHSLFDEIVSGTEVAHGKPAPDIFLRAAERIGCRPEECLVLEDSENGVKAGHAAGCMTIMVPDLMEASPEILPYCFQVCENLLQVQELLKAQELPQAENLPQEKELS